MSIFLVILVLREPRAIVLSLCCYLHFNNEKNGVCCHSTWQCNDVALSHNETKLDRFLTCVCVYWYELWAMTLTLHLVSVVCTWPCVFRAEIFVITHLSPREMNEHSWNFHHVCVFLLWVVWRCLFKWMTKHDQNCSAHHFDGCADILNIFVWSFVTHCAMTKHSHATTLCLSGTYTCMASLTR